MSDTFLRHVGPPHIHDATVQRLERSDSTVQVWIRSYQGKSIQVDFLGVAELIATEAEGMLLCALAEMAGNGSHRRFVFVNWFEPGEEGIERQLEVSVDDVQFR